MNIIKKKYILFKMEKNSDENGDCKKYFHSVCVFKCKSLVNVASRIHCISSKLPASELSSHTDNTSSEENCNKETRGIKVSFIKIIHDSTTLITKILKKSELSWLFLSWITSEMRLFCITYYTLSK